MTEVNGSAANVCSTRNVSRSSGELSQLLLVITLPPVATRRYHYNVSVTVTHSASWYISDTVMYQAFQVSRTEHLLTLKYPLSVLSNGLP